MLGSDPRIHRTLAAAAVVKGAQVWLRRRAGMLATVVVILIAGGGAFSAAQATTFFERAQQHFDAGDLEAAEIELKNTLQRDSNNAEARFLLGKLYLQRGDPAPAEKELSRAWELGLQGDEVRLLIARARIALGDFSGAIETVLADLDLASPFAQDLFTARGEALLAIGRREEAAQTFRDVIAMRPHARAYAGLARAEFQAQRINAAFGYIDDALALAPSDSRYHELKGRFNSSIRRFREAAADYLRAIELDGENVEALVGLANLKVVERQFREADDLLDQAGEIAPRSLVVVLLKSYVALTLQEYDLSQELSETILAVDEGLTTALYVSGVSAYAMRRLEHSRSRLIQYLEAVPQDRHARAILDDIENRKGAVREPSADESINQALLSAVSYVAVDAGKRQLELRRQKFKVEASPQNPRLRAELSAAEANSGDYSQAVDELYRALALENEDEKVPEIDRAMIRLAIDHIRRGEHGTALDVLMRIQERLPDRPIGYSLEGVVHAQMQNFGLAEAALERALSMQPGSPEILTNLASLQVRQGNLEAAIDFLERAIAENPKNYPTLLRLGQLSLQRGQRDEAIGWFEKAIAAEDNSVAARNLLARIYFAERDFQRVVSVTEASSGDLPKDRALLTLLGNARLELKQSEEAVTVFRRLVKVVPNSAEAHFLLASAYAQVPSRADALGQLQTALQIDPNHFRSRMTLAQIYLAGNEPDAAAPIIEGLVLQYRANLDVVSMQGDLALQQGDHDLAIDRLRVVHNIAKASSSAIRLARAQWKVGQSEASLATLETWIASNPSDSSARLQAGAFYTSLGRLDDGLRHFLAVAEERPSNWVAHNQVAWLLTNKGDFDAALGFAEHAYDLAPESAAVLDTLGVVLMRRNALERALSVLEKASRLAPNDPQIAFHRAQALAISGDVAASRSILNDVLSSNAAFQDRRAAEDLLRDLPLE